MTDFRVSRQQQRRGNHANLPQPLRDGELGFCIDDQRLYIGSNPNVMPPAIQAYPDFLTQAQSVADNQIIRVGVNNGTFVLADFITYMALYVSADHIRYNNVDTVYVVIATGQIAIYAGTIRPYMLAFGASVLTVVMGVGITFDHSGLAAMSTHLDSGGVAFLINLILGGAACNEKSNVEILTEYTPQIDFITVSLPTSGAFIDMPSSLLSFVTTNVDTLRIEYSVYLHNGADMLQENGQILVVASTDQASAQAFQTSSKMNSMGLAGSVLFQAVYVSAGAYKLQYKNTLSATATLRYRTEAWRSH